MIVDQISGGQAAVLSLIMLGVGFAASALLQRIREYRAMYTGKP